MKYFASRWAAKRHLAYLSGEARQRGNGRGQQHHGLIAAQLKRLVDVEERKGKVQLAHRVACPRSLSVCAHEQWGGAVGLREVGILARPMQPKCRPASEWQWCQQSPFP